MAFGRRLSGIGTPALAHMAAALALAISSNWSLSKESKGRKETEGKLKQQQTMARVVREEGRQS